MINFNNISINPTEHVEKTLPMERIYAHKISRAIEKQYGITIKLLDRDGGIYILLFNNSVYGIHSLMICFNDYYFDNSKKHNCISVLFSRSDIDYKTLLEFIDIIEKYIGKFVIYQLLIIKCLLLIKDDKEREKLLKRIKKFCKVYELR